MPNLIIAVAKSPRYGPRYISASNNFSLVAKQRDVFAWGLGIFGQMGDNAAVNRCTPVQVCGGYCFCRVAAGQNTGFAIDINGQAYAWGLGSSGQLGNNTVTNFVSTPVAVAGTYTFCEIASRSDFAVALTNTGLAYSWGSTLNYGELGNNAIGSRSSPVAVCCNYTFCKISVGQQEVCGLTNLGVVYCWGYGGVGAIGNNSLLNRCVPTAACIGLLNFCDIAVGNSNVVAITSSGVAYCWGQNTSGQLGDNSVVNKSTPVAVCGGLTFSSVGAGINCAFGITSAGVLYAWGTNYFGTLGDNTATSRSTPVAVCGGITFCRVYSGLYHTIGVDNVGRVYAWGINIYSVLDNNLGQMLPVCGGLTFCDLDAGGYQVIAITDTNVPYGWGLNTIGQLGDNSVVDKYTPVAICGNLSFNVVASGTGSSCGLTNAGAAYCWGNGAGGRLGDNSVVNKSTPVAVCGGLNFSKIAVNQSFATAITSAGVLYAWGSGANGRLGDNSTVSKSTPVAVCGAGRVYCEVKSGNGFSVSVTNAGVLYSWGINTAGALGDNSVVAKSTPVAVCGAGRNYCVVDTSLQNGFAAAITNTGSTFMWGYNLYGNLGNNSTVSVSTPVAVCGALTFCQIALGYTHTMALTNTGAAYGWGDNQFGQLGINSAANYSTPVAVCGALTFCKIAAGDGWTVAITNTGVAYGWGQNQTGQLGGFRAYTPTLVSFL